jgi:hypothetical protein
VVVVVVSLVTVTRGMGDETAALCSIDSGSDSLGASLLASAAGVFSRGGASAGAALVATMGALGSTAAGAGTVCTSVGMEAEVVTVTGTLAAVTGVEGTGATALGDTLERLIFLCRVMSSRILSSLATLF